MDAMWTTAGGHCRDREVGACVTCRHRALTACLFVFAFANTTTVIELHCARWLRRSFVEALMFYPVIEPFLSASEFMRNYLGLIRRGINHLPPRYQTGERSSFPTLQVSLLIRSLRRLMHLLLRKLSLGLSRLTVIER